ncbi:MAG: MFS transporter, partial [Solirubrobacterales bacterium]|nr:MFS transporter [Solirubrobacterales bacterium]
AAMVLSIGIFFSLLIVGLSAHLPATLQAGLRAHGVPPAQAAGLAHLPPVASLFAAFLGYNPIQKLVGPVLLHHLPVAQASALTSRSFFPHLMGGPFSDALGTAFTFACIACLIAAGASWLRGGKYHYQEEQPDAEAAREPGAAAEPAPAPSRPATTVSPP